MSDSHGKDLATVEHGEQPLFPLPPHHQRITDTDPRAARRAQRQVYIQFLLSALLTIAFVVAYWVVPVDAVINLGPAGVWNLSNLLLGLTMGGAILLIGTGAIHWAKKLMSDEELVDERHPVGSPEEDRAEAKELFETGLAESGFAERKIVRRSLIGALLLFPIPFIAFLRDMGPMPGTSLRNTVWKQGTRILVDISGQPLRPEDLQVGTLVSASPEGLAEIQEEERTQNARAKASIILVRMRPDQIRSEQAPEGETWSYEGILAYSKICTHVGCPIALYQQRSHHLLCPCHQSTFDLADSGNVVFGPAARRMPQLPITVDEEGYLVAQSDFAEPVGPSFWERG